MPRHIEQPGSRQSKPARERFCRALRLRPAPSRPANREPPWRSRRCTLWPAAIRAAARRSSMRPLVQEPMKTRSMLTSSSGVPAFSPMYSSARSKPLAILLAGAASRDRAPCRNRRDHARARSPAYVWASVAASITSSRSNFAPHRWAASPLRDCRSQAAPCGQKRGP
jgi:hypothetical protein